MTKPVILLVPGAWHSPSGFAPLTNYLTQHGYIVEGISLPSVGSSPPQMTFDADVQAIASAISRHSDEGSDIVILFHSYGGIPGTSACKGLLKSDRSSTGRNRGIVHLIYCCAFAVEEGVCLMDGLGGQPLPWFKFSSDGKSLMPETPEDKFYHDIDDPKLLQELVSNLRPQSYGPYFSKSTYAAWRDVHSTYVMCQEDQALPFEVQRTMVANVKKVLAESGGRIEMQVHTLDSSHSPFLSRPKELGDIVRSVAESFQTLGQGELSSES
ncbi:uncharacterized protein Z520_09683 [Fonsecaea multimorphosa CBS 102226]|uniref:AB hydrolase-1 domain-containing protein n=1 Tax=Fonsecaea multimorphosa CBS 102226 TaxID=1442371 RepID=A0A0D2JMT3_9EURO|nr:uncharacterized protein Z520_09683 [Fonsecaea multimorphosa CBS 102226]KIX94637.1 hypothetical protein Z520_09683 [Fonsecaea multimorphosa CBS 102226]OAL20343.1 hypothetical protein AYO22_09055 [Fonsecaea multimorphosa]